MWICICLLWLSVEDFLEGQVSMAVILALGVTGGCYALYTGQRISFWPGVLLLVSGYFTDEQIGYGDGWLILALGMWASSERLLGVLFGGMALSAVWAVCRKKKEVPLVPFLTISYVIGELL